VTSAAAQELCSSHGVGLINMRGNVTLSATHQQQQQQHQHQQQQQQQQQYEWTRDL
jgi:hypothetical protein